MRPTSCGSVWRSVMTWRSASALRPKVARDPSSCSRCWPVTSVSTSTCPARSRAATTGAILFASGRVPNATTTRGRLPPVTGTARSRRGALEAYLGEARERNGGDEHDGEAERHERQGRRGRREQHARDAQGQGGGPEQD